MYTSDIELAVSYVIEFEGENRDVDGMCLFMLADMS